MTSFYQNHQKFFISVDCIIFGFKDGQLQLLIQRRPYYPGLGEMSLLGGFVGMFESVDEAAQRVLKDFTGLDHVYMNQLGAFGDINRDPGERVITIAYYALVKANDLDEIYVERNGAQWVNIEDVPQLFSDHNIIVEEAHKKLRQSIGNKPIGRNLLPENFTLTQLQALYEAILGSTLDKRNFRRTILEKDYIVSTGLVDKTTSRRGAQLYRYAQSAYGK